MKNVTNEDLKKLRTLKSISEFLGYQVSGVRNDYEYGEFNYSIYFEKPETEFYPVLTVSCEIDAANDIRVSYEDGRESFDFGLGPTTYDTGSGYCPDNIDIDESCVDFYYLLDDDMHKTSSEEDFVKAVDISPDLLQKIKNIAIGHLEGMLEDYVEENIEDYVDRNDEDNRDDYWRDEEDY